MLISSCLTLFFIFILYFVASLRYYAKQIHPFDPYLQNPNVRYVEDAKKNKNTYRILCLGGSTTAGKKSVSLVTYPEKMQEILSEHYPSINFEVLNAGRAWYTTKHSLINYVTYYRDWHPDLIIEMHAINDLFYSFSPPSFAFGEYNNQYSHFYGAAINGLKPQTFEKRIVGEFFDLIENLNFYWYEGKMHVSCYTFLRMLNPPCEKDLPLENFLSIGAFEKYLKTTVQYAKYDKVKIVLVTEPSLYKEEMDASEKQTLWFGSSFCRINDKGKLLYPSFRSLYKAMQKYNRIIEQIGLIEKVPVINAAEKIPRNLYYFVDDCHYTNAGTELIAHLIAGEIIRLGFIKEN